MRGVLRNISSEGAPYSDPGVKGLGHVKLSGYEQVIPLAHVYEMGEYTRVEDFRAYVVVVEATIRMRSNLDPRANLLRKRVDGKNNEKGKEGIHTIHSYANVRSSCKLTRTVARCPEETYVAKFSFTRITVMYTTVVYTWLNALCNFIERQIVLG